MAQSHSLVPTEQASRYLQQLAKHWAHKFAVEFSPEAGTIDAGEGRVVTMAALPDTLQVTVSAPDEQVLQVWRQVVQDHLVRFGFREELVFDWQDGGLHS